MNSKVCYTCIYRSTDVLNEILYKTQGWDYICISFIDKEITSTTWDVRYIGHTGIELFDSLPIEKKASSFKITPTVIFEDYDYSLYVDSTIQINQNLNLLYEMHCGSYVSTLLHPTSNCVYPEFLNAIENNLDDQLTLERQLKRYRNEGYPLNYGLYDTRIIGMHHTEESVMKLMADWVSIMNDNSYIDYLSFPYALWKNGMRENVSILPINLYNITNEQ